MAELRSALERSGVTVRQTYLQSGNIVFDAPRAPATALASRIEAAVRPRLVRPTAAVVLGARQLGRVLTDAPADWGAGDVTFVHHVVFLARIHRSGRFGGGNRGAGALTGSLTRW
jgi:uncharacterized protein (DUF1697 family)